LDYQGSLEDLGGHTGWDVSKLLGQEEHQISLQTRCTRHRFGKCCKNEEVANCHRQTSKETETFSCKSAIRQIDRVFKNRAEKGNRLGHGENV